jgi:transcriptional regulator NrdR family protein
MENINKDVRFCPMCENRTRVYWSKLNGGYLQRYRQCKDCDFKFTTKEVFSSVLIKDAVFSSEKEKVTNVRYCTKCGGRSPVNRTLRTKCGINRRRKCKDCDTVFYTNEVDVSSEFRKSLVDECYSCGRVTKVIVVKEHQGFIYRVRFCENCGTETKTQEKYTVRWNIEQKEPIKKKPKPKPKKRTLSKDEIRKIKFKNLFNKVKSEHRHLGITNEK